MEEMFRVSRERTNARIRKEIMENKKQHRKEVILTTFIALFILTITIIQLCKMDNNFMNDCQAAGHTQEYCERGM